MILAIDVGNTHTVVGVYQYSQQDTRQDIPLNPQLIQHWRLK